MNDDQPQPDRPRPLPRLINVTEQAKALVITGQSKPDDEPRKKPFKLRNVTGTAEGGDLQIIGAKRPEREPDGDVQPEDDADGESGDGGNV